MKSLLKSLTYWIWKSDIKEYNSTIQNYARINEQLKKENADFYKLNKQCKLEQEQEAKAKRNFIDDIRDVARGSSIESQIDEMIKQYEK